MYFVFYRTTDVFSAEEMLTKKNIQVDVVQTPVQDKAYCGVCIEVPDNYAEESQKFLSDVLEYRMIQKDGGEQQ